MGLEAVELVIEIEHRFKTNLCDSEVEKISTVGQLYELLMDRIQKHNSNRCLTSSIFYSIRKILTSHYDICRIDVHPLSTLNELILTKKRLQFWQTMKKKFSPNLPSLKRSRIVQWHGDKFPETIVTIGDLVHECAKSFSITNEFDVNDQESVWIEVCKIVSEVACVEPKNLLPETHFVDHLGF